jgi:hypothetical protein
MGLLAQEHSSTPPTPFRSSLRPSRGQRQKEDQSRKILSAQHVSLMHQLDENQRIIDMQRMEISQLRNHLLAQQQQQQLVRTVPPDSFTLELTACHRQRDSANQSSRRDVYRPPYVLADDRGDDRGAAEEASKPASLE